jgi:hypothetical protein
LRPKAESSGTGSAKKQERERQYPGHRDLLEKRSGGEERSGKEEHGREAERCSATRRHRNTVDGLGNWIANHFFGRIAIS